MIETIDPGRDPAGPVTPEGCGPHTTEEEARASLTRRAGMREGDSGESIR